MRRAFADALMQAAEADPRVIFLTGDLGFGTFDEFRARFGPRYVNVGVAEAQLVCAAAGLALEGWHPLVYSIASFMTGRPFEQIRVSVAYPALPVILVGAGGGYTYASSGVTHHAAEDLGLMSALPNMTVTAPGDADEVRQLLPQLLALAGPAYFRIGKYGERSFHGEVPATLGRARLLQSGEGIAVVTTGTMAAVAMQAAEELRAAGIVPWVFQIHTVKPLDAAWLKWIAGQVGGLVVVEEHLPTGGLAGAIGLRLAETGVRLPLVRLGPPDQLLLGSPTQDQAWQRWGCDVSSVVAACRRMGGACGIGELRQRSGTAVEAGGTNPSGAKGE